MKSLQETDIDIEKLLKNFTPTTLTGVDPKNFGEALNTFLNEEVFVKYRSSKKNVFIYQLPHQDGITPLIPLLNSNFLKTAFLGTMVEQLDPPLKGYLTFTSFFYNTRFFEVLREKIPNFEKSDLLSQFSINYSHDRFSPFLEKADRKIFHENLIRLLLNADPEKRAYLKNFYWVVNSPVFSQKVFEALLTEVDTTRQQTCVNHYIEILEYDAALEFLALLSYQSTELFEGAYKLAVARFKDNRLENLQKDLLGKIIPNNISNKVKKNLESIQNFEKNLLSNLKILCSQWFEKEGFHLEANFDFLKSLLESGLNDLSLTLIQNLSSNTENGKLFSVVASSKISIVNKIKSYSILAQKIVGSTLAEVLAQNFHTKIGYRALVAYSEGEVFNWVFGTKTESPKAAAKDLIEQFSIKESNDKPLLHLACEKNPNLSVIRKLAQLAKNIQIEVEIPKKTGEKSQQETQQIQALDRTWYGDLAIHTFFKWRRFNLTPEALALVGEDFRVHLNSRNAQGFTPIMLLIKHGIFKNRFETVVTENLLEQFQALLEMGGRIENKEDAYMILKYALCHPKTQFMVDLFKILYQKLLDKQDNLETKRFVENIFLSPGFPAYLKAYLFDHNLVVIDSNLVKKPEGVERLLESILEICSAHKTIGALSSILFSSVMSPLILEYLNNNLKEYKRLVSILETIDFAEQQRKTVAVFLQWLKQKMINFNLPLNQPLPADPSGIFFEYLEERERPDVRNAFAPIPITRPLLGQNRMGEEERAEIHKRALSAGAAYPR